MLYIEDLPLLDDALDGKDDLLGGVSVYSAESMGHVPTGREVYLRAGSDSEGNGVYLTRDEATQVRDGLTVILDSLPIAEPEGVIAVMDSAGDLWRRFEDGHYDCQTDGDHKESFDALVRSYGPVLPLFGGVAVQAD